MRCNHTILGMVCEIRSAFIWGKQNLSDSLCYKSGCAYIKVSYIQGLLYLDHNRNMLNARAYLIRSTEKHNGP